MYMLRMLHTILAYSINIGAKRDTCQTDVENTSVQLLVRHKNGKRIKMKRAKLARVQLTRAKEKRAKLARNRFCIQNVVSEHEKKLQNGLKFPSHVTIPRIAPQITLGGRVKACKIIGCNSEYFWGYSHANFLFYIHVYCGFALATKMLV